MTATPIPREMLLHVAKSLPAAPRILAELGHLLIDPNSDMSVVTALLRRDTALTARIIRISNSAFYNVGHPYASLEEALARVGYMEVYRLTGFAAVSQVADKPLALYGVSGAEVRRNSLLTALLAEILAERVGIEARMAYTAGLMRSVGKIALDGAARSGPNRGTYPGISGGPLAKWEFGLAGIDNCEAAGIILKEWRFPAVIVAAVREHYLLRNEASPVAQLLNIAAGAAERGGHPFPGETDYWQPLPVALESVELTPEDVDEALQSALEQFDPVRAAVS